MPLTNEQAKIAQAIQTKYRRLALKGKSQAKILAAMQGELPRFKLLLDANVVQEAADLYPGFQQFAKLLEHLAAAIEVGAIAVPGRPAAPRPTEPINEFDGLAAAMDLRMQQLDAQGVPDSAVMDGWPHMSLTFRKSVRTPPTSSTSTSVTSFLASTAMLNSWRKRPESRAPGPLSSRHFRMI